MAFRARMTRRCGRPWTRRKACGLRSEASRAGMRRSFTPSISTKLARVKNPGRSRCWTWSAAAPWTRKSQAVRWSSSSATRAQASRSSPTFRSRWFTCQRFQTWSLRAGPATAIGPIAWPRWITVPGKSLTQSSRRASKTTRSSYSPATMARRRPTLGRVTTDPGVGPTSRRWRVYYVHRL